MDDQTNTDENVNKDSVAVQSGQSSNAPAPTSAVESIKKEALATLAPLIDEIDAAPERKFEIVMTAIRVNFDENLLRKALEAAKTIEEPSAKAEALIDIVNEANFQESES